MEIKGFRVVSNGDSSVGIFQAEWEVSGGFFFDDKEELNQFRSKLKEAFELIADDSWVETFEERAELLKKEEEQLNGAANK